MKPSTLAALSWWRSPGGSSHIASRLALNEISSPCWITPDLRFVIAALAILVPAKPDVSCQLLIATASRCFFWSVLAQAFALAMACRSPVQRDRAKPGAVHPLHWRRSSSAKSILRLPDSGIDDCHPGGL